MDLSATTAAILGQGNVALDVARILLTPIDELKKTDITEHALNALSESKLKELYLIGRRGPLQVAFTIKELREQLKMNACSTIWRKEDFDGINDIVSDLARPRKRLTELMLKSVNEMKEENIQNKLFRPIFFRSPSKFLVDLHGNISGIELIKNKLIKDQFEQEKCVPTELKEVINCQLAFRSIGYKSKSLDKDLNFDLHNGILINDKGRVVFKDSDKLGKVYVAGWLGTGPIGVILHTMGHAFQVAKVICEDLKTSDDSSPLPGFKGLQQILDSKDVKVVDWSAWERIDKYEIEEGKKLNKPREKICNVQKMIEVAL